MPRINLDVNFPIMIIILAILLVAVVEGGRINELVYHKSGDVGRVLFSFIFLMGGMFVIFGLLTAPDAIRKVVFVTMTIGLLVIFANMLTFFLEGKIDLLTFAEVISGSLIIAGGVLLLMNRDELE